MHPVRKAFRGSLLVILGMSIAFMGFMVFLRITYRDKPLDGPFQATVFKADVMQHRARAFVSNDVQDMVIIEKLFALGFYSPIYTDAGYRMLQEKAEDNYPPAVERLAQVEVYFQGYQD